MFDRFILADALENLQLNLNEYWPKLTGEVEKQYPLSEAKKEMICRDGPSKCINAVKGWAYKKSGNRASEKMHWITYQANLSRSGMKFISKSNGHRTEYFWMGDMSHAMLSMIVKDWNQALHHGIPSMADNAERVIDKIWVRFMADLNAKILKAEPRLLLELKNEEDALTAYKKKATNELRQALRRISEDTGQVYHLVADKARYEWEETFEEAMQITGPGCHGARQQVVLSFAQRRSKATLKNIYDDLDETLRAQFDELPEELISISNSIIYGLRSYLEIFIDKVLGSTDSFIKSEDVAEEKVSLRRTVKYELEDWMTGWQSTSLERILNDDEADQIPEGYQHGRTELEELEAGDDSQDSESDLGTDSD